MARISASIWLSVSRRRSSVPPRFQARQPLRLISRASHISDSANALPCASIQAYFTAHPSRSTPPLFS